MPQATVSTSVKTQQWRQLKKTLHTQFHFKDLRPGQEEIIRSVLAGKNTLAILPTGAGKSLCYQLPTLQFKGTTIVISPLISLMKDQREKVEDKGMSAVELNSSIGQVAIRDGLEKVSHHETEILYVTPERFTHPDFIQSLHAAQIDLVVIDEAHCVSQWGHDFRPAYLSIRETLSKMGKPVILALTATATEAVAADIQKQLGLKELAIFRSSVFRKNLILEARYLNTVQEKFETLAALVCEMKELPGIIYTSTVKAAEEIHELLKRKGIESVKYHGKLKTKEREENQNAFMNSSTKLMVATNAFGMGIDKADIRYVIHFQFPGSLEAYYQEAGRAGRDGEKSRCILLYLKRDKCTQSLFLSGRYPTSDEIAHVYEILKRSELHGDPLERVRIEEKIADTIAHKKNAVIFALLKDLKILKETKKHGLHLLKTDLTAETLKELAQCYSDRSEEDHRKLDQMIIYAQSALCRWKNILRYFNETSHEENCGQCDNCVKHHG